MYHRVKLRQAYEVLFGGVEMPVAGLFSGVLGWLFFGAAIYAWLTFDNTYNVTNSPQSSFSDPGVGSGPWAHPTSSQTPIPLVFGTTRSSMPIIHYRLEGSKYQDMWLVCAVGEDWSTLEQGYATAVGDVWLNDTKLSKFSRFTIDPNLFDKEHDWCNLFPNGRGASIHWSSAGKHTFQTQAKVDAPIESYNLQVSHDVAGASIVQCTVRLIHQFIEGGTTQAFKVSAVYSSPVSGSPTIILFNSSVTKTATQTVQQGKETETVNVAGTGESTYTANLPYRGTFKIKVELFSSSNGGKLYLDSIELTDSILQSEPVDSYGTSLLLIHVRDVDGTMSKPNVSGMVTGGPSNPAEALLWLLQNKEVSLGIKADYIDEISFMESASKCDESGYSFNRAYCSTSSFEGVIADMTRAGRLLLGEYGGKLACIYDEEIPAVNTRTVDMMTMADNTNYGDCGLQNIPNRFLLKYVDQFMESTAQDIVLEDASLQQKAGVINEKSIDLYGVTTQSKTWELGWYHAKWAQASKWLEFDMKPILWDLSPATVITTVSTEDPYLHGKEWMLVGFDETEPNKYRAKAIEYKRDAYTAHNFVEEIPDVYIEEYVPSAQSEAPSVPSGTVVISLDKVEHTTDGVARVFLILSGIPSDGASIKLYRSYDGHTFGLLAQATITGPSLSYNYPEVQQWTFVWWKSTVVSSKGETSLDGAPMTQAYIVGLEEAVPGYGLGEYGRQPYGY